MYEYFFKRSIDILLSMIGLLLFSPIFMLISILLFAANKGNPYFVQLRPGKGLKPFKIYKFKTMNNDIDIEGNLQSDEHRITPIGKIIRKTSLDEIPQLFNVLKGDMSVIGPRPLLLEYVHLYTKFQKRRHEVKPGITGWAQVNGRNTISWKEKFELDVWYVDNLSFLLDWKIISLTLFQVLKSQGINQQGRITMEEFTGNN